MRLIHRHPETRIYIHALKHPISPSPCSQKSCSNLRFSSPSTIAGVSPLNYRCMLGGGQSGGKWSKDLSGRRKMKRRLHSHVLPEGEGTQRSRAQGSHTKLSQLPAFQSWQLSSLARSLARGVLINSHGAVTHRQQPRAGCSCFQPACLRVVLG